MSYGIGRTPGHRVIVRTSLLALLLAAAPLTAQERRRLTAEDYARAERFLPANTVPLVTNVAASPPGCRTADSGTGSHGGRPGVRAARPRTRPPEPGVRPRAPRLRARDGDGRTRGADGARHPGAPLLGEHAPGRGQHPRPAVDVRRGGVHVRRGGHDARAVPRAARLGHVTGRALGRVHPRPQPVGQGPAHGRGHAAHDRRRRGLRLRHQQRRLDAQRSSRAALVARLAEDRDLPARRPRRER